MKAVVLSALLVTLTGCSPASLVAGLLPSANGSASPAAASPSAPASPAASANPAAVSSPAASGTTPVLAGGLTTVTDAELDALIACAKTKGTLGAALVNGWGGIKVNIAESGRAMLKPAIEIQAKGIGCL